MNVFIVKQKVVWGCSEGAKGVWQGKSGVSLVTARVYAGLQLCHCIEFASAVFITSQANLVSHIHSFTSQKIMYDDFATFSRR